MVKRSAFSRRRRPAKFRRIKGAVRIAKTAVRNKWAIGAQRKVARRVNALYKMIETKEGCLHTGANLGIAHNNISILTAAAGGPSWLNPFFTTGGTNDPMGQSNAPANRIGDSISVRGVLFKAFFENALGRSKVHYRLWLVRMAKGDTLDRSTFFRNNSDNKIIDQINTERYTIVASRKFTISASNAQAANVGAVSGAPEQYYNGTGVGGQATRAISMWIPGRRFGRRGNLTYENTSSSQIKFYDYKYVLMAYDWYGTPQDINNVGKLNEAYTKLYFKDA